MKNVWNLKILDFLFLHENNFTQDLGKMVATATSTAVPYSLAHFVAF